MDKFGQFLAELSAHNYYIFSFQDNNLCKFQWIFTQLHMRIDTVEIWFGIAIFDRDISQWQDNGVCVGGGGYYCFTFLFYIWLVFSASRF